MGAKASGGDLPLEAIAYETAAQRQPLLAVGAFSIAVDTWSLALGLALWGLVWSTRKQLFRHG